MIFNQNCTLYLATVQLNASMCMFKFAYITPSIINIFSITSLLNASQTSNANAPATEMNCGRIFMARSNQETCHRATIHPCTNFLLYVYFVVFQYAMAWPSLLESSLIVFSPDAYMDIKFYLLNLSTNCFNNNAASEGAALT